MANIITPPPQEKSDIAAQQNVQQFTYKVKEEIKKLLKSAEMPPQILIQLGNMAMAAIKDQALYPVVVDATVKAGLLNQDQVVEGMDYKLLASLATAGKVAKMIEAEGGY
jgi:hypothetical protein